MIVMRSGNEISLVPFDDSQGFFEQVEQYKKQPEDKALCKIIEHNDVFYLESATFMRREEDRKKL